MTNNLLKLLTFIKLILKAKFSLGKGLLYKKFKVMMLNIFAWIQPKIKMKNNDQ